MSTLTHSGSISWLQVQTLLLFSHADCNYFTHKLLHSCPPPHPATVSFSFFFVSCVLFWGWLSIFVASDTHHTTLESNLAKSTASTTRFTQLWRKGYVSPPRSQWQEEEKKDVETCRRGWIASSRNYHRQVPLRAACEASGAELCSSSSGNESVEVDLKVKAKQLKLD